MSMRLPLFKVINLLVSDGKAKGLSNQEIFDSFPAMVKAHYNHMVSCALQDGHAEAFDIDRYLQWTEQVYAHRYYWASADELRENDEVIDQALLSAIQENK